MRKTPRTGRVVGRALGTVVICAAVAALSPPSFPRAHAKEIEFPETGTPVARARTLWQASRTHVLDDAKAALSDAEYQKRRSPIWGAWTRLQMSIAGEDDQVSRIIPDILGLLNDTYGWTADPPARRQEVRDDRRKFIPGRVAEIDERIAALR